MKTGLFVGLGIMGLLAVFMIVELFSGPVNPLAPTKGSGQATNPGGFGTTGYQITKTANQATNTANVVTGDIGQVAGDISAVVGIAQGLLGGSSDDGTEDDS